MGDEFLLPPPASMVVNHDHKPVLYQADGRALVRQAGFVVGGRAMQTRGTNPSLVTGGKKIGGKKKC